MTTGLQLLRAPLEPAPGGLAQAAIGQLLDPIGERADEQITTQPWRMTPIEPPPFDP